MNMYDLTVLIPTYNRKERLTQTLDCLSKQTNRSFQIVITDNCSDYDVNELIQQCDEDLDTTV